MTFPLMHYHDKIYFSQSHHINRLTDLNPYDEEQEQSVNT